MGYGFSITPNVPHMKRYEIRIINFKNKTNEN